MERHRTDLLSLLAGMLFVVAGLLLLSGGTDGLPMQWTGPAVAIGLGIVIVAGVRPAAHAREDAPSEGEAEK